MEPAMPDLRAVFSEALEQETPEALSKYLDKACDGNAQLRSQIEALLQAHREAGGFLANSGMPTDASPPAIAERPGMVIGRYKLLQQIGEGGMGVVFMAEQQEPVVRKVALKIIKPGMDTKQVVARFKAEEQALAMMDHPNIAKVLDADTTETGRPYFVMELVRGVPITEYCDQNNLSPSDRLSLFVSVCQAVQHAHMKGVIHRDIKPTNILVTLHDGVPVVKVIDFGVAKALNHRLTQETLFTRFEQMIGTPMYMSPEQAEMSGLDVDTRTDVYSLGVLLYELLTGTTPIDRERLRVAAYDEIRRIIREEEPLKPSTRLSTLGETLSTVSQHRKTEPRKLPALVRGDLDWIVMKALEKDRTRRYETAKDFAADIQRHMCNKPVEARSPTALYRFSKYARRHKRTVASAAAIAAVLVIATGISTWLAVEAIAAEKAAERSAFEAQESERRLQHMMGELAESYLAQREYDLAAELYLRLSEIRRLSHGPSDPETLKATLGLAVARCRQGRMTEALRLYRVVESFLGDNDPSVRGAAEAISGAYVWDMWKVFCERDLTAEESSAMMEWAVRAVELDPQGASWFMLAWMQYSNSEWETALKSLEKSISYSIGESSAWTWSLMARANWQLGREKRAVDCFAVASNHVPGDSTYHRMQEFMNDTATMIGLTDAWPSLSWPEAELLALYDRLLDDYPNNVELLYRSGLCHGRQQNWEECIGAIERALEIQQQRSGPTFQFEMALGVIQLYLGEHARYSELCREALASNQRDDDGARLVEFCSIGRPEAVNSDSVANLGKRSLNKKVAASTRLAFGMAAYRNGQHERAERTLEEIKQYGAKTALCLSFKALSVLQQNRTAEARHLLGQALESAETWLPTPDGPQLTQPPGGKDRLLTWCMTQAALREAEAMIGGDALTETSKLELLGGDTVPELSDQ